MFANVAKIAYLRGGIKSMWSDVVETIVMAIKVKPGEPGAKINPQGRGDFMVSYAVFMRAFKLGGVNIPDPHWTLLLVCQSKHEAIDDCRRMSRHNDEDYVECRYVETDFYVDGSVRL